MKTCDTATLPKQITGPVTQNLQLHHQLSAAERQLPNPPLESAVCPPIRTACCASQSHADYSTQTARMLSTNHIIMLPQLTGGYHHGNSSQTKSKYGLIRYRESPGSTLPAQQQGSEKRCV